MVWMQHVITPLRIVLALLGLSTLGPFFYFIYFRQLFKAWVREQCSGNGISRSCVFWNAFSAQAKQWNRWNPKPSWWLLISSGISVPVPSILEMAGLRNVTFFFQSKISRDFCSVLQKKIVLTLQCFEYFIGGTGGGGAGKRKYWHMNNVRITKRVNINWVKYFFLSPAHCTFVLFPAQQNF